MFTLLVGSPPFWHRKQMVMLRNIMEGKYSFTSPEWADITGKKIRLTEIAFQRMTNFRFSNARKILIQTCTLFYFAEAPKDLIRKLLVVDPRKRISIKEALEHSFFHTVVSIFLLYTYIFII